MRFTTREDIVRWFEEGQRQDATHMIVVCDMFDWEDFPVYVSAEENVQEKYEEEQKSGRVMEVYSLCRDMKAQLNEHRAFHFD